RPPGGGGRGPPRPPERPYPARFVRGEVGEHGFAGDGRLADGDERRGAPWQVDVEARAEADHAEALAGEERLAFLHLADDATGDEARDLHHGDGAAIFHADGEPVAFIVHARLVE